MISLTRYRKIYYIFSGLMVAASIAALFLWGLKLGIDFTGGSILEIEYQDKKPGNDEILASLQALNIGQVVLQPAGDKEIILRTKYLDEKVHQDVLGALRAEDKNKFEEKSFEAIGPVIGEELKRKAVIAIGMVLMAIFIYIALAFRKVKFPLSSWHYGVATLVALFHDVIFPLGVFAVLGHLYNIEIDLPFIAAILTVLGYSVHDTIVVFDRIRENILKNPKEDFEGTVNISLRQTFIRSINTSLTVILALLAIYFFGGESIKYFALTLILGIAVGTYSSIFIASPLLVTWWNFTKRKQG